MNSREPEHPLLNFLKQRKEHKNQPSRIEAAGLNNLNALIKKEKGLRDAKRLLR